MLIIPALDLWKGKVVRLTRGDPSLCTTYSDDSVSIAKKWEKEGAKLLHLVDLSAALSDGDNLAIIKDILKEIKTGVEVGGGIRDIKKAEELISAGAERIIIGTKGLEEKFLDKIIDSLGSEKIAVGVDVKNSFLAIEGWKRETKYRGIDFISHLQDKGIKWVIYTDISRDGTLGGVNLNDIKKLSSFKELNIIASGGVSSLDDLIKLKQSAPFIYGIIVGKALYENKILLPEVIAGF